MSWLNFNDSLNNLKGQLSNLASGVLADTNVESAEVASGEKQYEELQQLITNQAEEILRLRKENTQLSENSATNRNGHPEAGDKWSWDPPDTSQSFTAPNEVQTTIENLKKQVSFLENEKKDLVVSLEQLDLDCQQTTEKVINLKDALQSKYDDLQEEHESVLQERDKLLRENGEKTHALQQLQIEKSKLSIDNKSELKKHIRELEEVNLKLTQQLEDSKNLPKEANEKQNADREELLKQIDELTLTLKEYEKGQVSNREEYEKLAGILQKYEEQLRNYKSQCELLQSENEKIMEREKTLLSELTLLKEALHKDDSSKTTKEIYRKCLNLLTDSFKEFMDYPLPIEESAKNENNLFMDAVETTMRILLDLKWKAETLKKEVDDMTDEKTKILAEKNREINKLLENSEVLSQEVISKTQALKNFEEENSELIKNNDQLINELEMYKFDNRALDTISETNEDNMLILEAQLEKSNRRIGELEMTISDLETSKQEGTIEVQSELDYIKQQLNITGTELSHSKKEYQKLLDEYKRLQSEHQDLRTDFDDVKSSYEKCYKENETLNTTVDKIQSEIENTEYRCSEININMETLREEADTLRKEIDDLTKVNKKLEMMKTDYEGKIELMQNEVDDLKQELIIEINMREEQEVQIRSLSEKLQNAKMSETSFKLQNDTLHKELNAITENHQQLTSTYKSLMVNYEEVENNLNKYKVENLELMQKCNEVEDTKLINAEMKSKVIVIEELKRQNSDLLEKLKISEKEVLRMEEENQNINGSMTILDSQEYEIKISVLQKECEELQKRLITSNEEIATLTNEKQSLSSQLDRLSESRAEHSKTAEEYRAKIESLESNVQELTKARNDMINFVNAKHQENVQYHNEIQRLNQVLLQETERTHKLENDLKEAVDRQKIESLQNENISILEKENATMNEKIEKLTDQNDFLRKKSEVLAQNLLEEQSKVQQVVAEKNNALSEKEMSLSKELQRLREHLMEMEEVHTQEMLQAEKKISEMSAKMNEIEQREKESSTHYTSVNIRTNQHVETLQNQLQMVTNQRDELRKRMSDSEDEISKQAAALANLQFVLEQFQKDKQKDIYLETDRIRRQVNVEKQKQGELHREIANLRSQLDESKQGLLAASRLGNQVESSKQQVAAMKEEVQRLEEKLKISEEKTSALLNQTDAKVDKMLIKNLVVGFVGSNSNLNKDQYQILKIIATVLDFNQEDNEKVHINKSNQGSWLTSVLHPQTIPRDQELSQESLSQAFVRFLENESKPRQIPNLLDVDAAPLETTNSKKSITANDKPILMSEVVLPTFADFGQSRISSSILKDVLKDNS